MAAETRVPSYMGIPLYVAPDPERWPPLPSEMTRHHRHWPSTHPNLLRPPESHPSLVQLGGWALRQTGIQNVGQTEHNLGVNALHRYWLGPEIPTDEDGQFDMVLLELAGMVPPDGYAVRRGEPVIERMTDAQLAIIRQPRPTQPIGYENIRHGAASQKFIEQYVLSMSLDHIRQRLKDQYLDQRTDPEVRRKLGHVLLAQQIEVAVARVRPDYMWAARTGLLDPRLGTMDPVGFVKRYLFGTQARQAGQLFPKLVAQLKQELSAA